MNNKLLRHALYLLMFCYGLVFFSYSQTAPAMPEAPAIMYSRNWDDVKIYLGFIMAAAVGRTVSQLLDKLIDRIK